MNSPSKQPLTAGPQERHWFLGAVLALAALAGLSMFALTASRPAEAASSPSAIPSAGAALPDTCTNTGGSYYAGYSSFVPFAGSSYGNGYGYGSYASGYANGFYAPGFYGVDPFAAAYGYGAYPYGSYVDTTNTVSYPCNSSASCSPSSDLVTAVCPAAASGASVESATKATCGSSTNIMVSLTDPQGRSIADGTDVTFTTTLGYITADTSTQNGSATASLVIPTKASGTAQITAMSGAAIAHVTVTVTC